MSSKPATYSPSASHLTGHIVGGCIILVIGLMITPRVSFPINYLVFAASIAGSVYTFYSIRNIHDLIVHNDRLEIKPLFGSGGREILFADIKSYTEIEQRRARSSKDVRRYIGQGSYDTWHELTLYTETDSYEISSQAYEDYDKIKQQLTKGKKYNTDMESKQTKNEGISRIVLPFIGVFLMLGYWAANPDTSGPIILAILVAIAIGLYRIMVSNKP